MTCQDLITASLRAIGVTAAGETPAPSELSDGFAALNLIVSSRSRDRAWVHTVVHGTFALVPGVRDYTIGPSGTFATSPAPVKVTAAKVVSGLFERGMEVLSFDDFSARSNNPTGASETLPGLLGADNARPRINLRVFPAPNAASQMELTWWVPLTQFVVLGETIALPEGYERALKYSLAMELAPEYGRPVPAEVAAIASEANAAITTLNKSINDPMPPPPAQ